MLLDDSRELAACGSSSQARAGAKACGCASGARANRESDGSLWAGEGSAREVVTELREWQSDERAGRSFSDASWDPADPADEKAGWAATGECGVPQVSEATPPVVRDDVLQALAESFLGPLDRLPLGVRKRVRLGLRAAARSSAASFDKAMGVVDHVGVHAPTAWDSLRSYARSRAREGTPSDPQEESALVDFLLYLLWHTIYSCPQAPGSLAIVQPASILAAYAVGWGPFGPNLILPATIVDGWSNYRGVMIDQGGLYAWEPSFLMDLSAVLDIIMANQALLRGRGFRWTRCGLPDEEVPDIGSWLAEMFVPMEGAGLDPMRVGQIRLAFQQGVYYPGIDRLRLNRWRIWTRGDRNALAGDAFGRSVVPRPNSSIRPIWGDCAPFVLRLLMKVLVHEACHRAFDFMDDRGSGGGCVCYGASYWHSAPYGHRHYFCEWIGANFVDWIWLPRRDAVPSSLPVLERNAARWNRITMREYSAYACHHGQAAVYDGGEPDLGFEPPSDLGRQPCLTC